MTGAERLAAAVAVSPRDRSDAHEHVCWARGAGLCPCSLGNALGRWLADWNDAEDALALAAADNRRAFEAVVRRMPWCITRP
jgi:hypothetical protein